MVTRIEQIGERISSNILGQPKNACYSLNEDSIEIQITDVLRSLGISPNLSGYKYNKEAIALALNDNTKLERITKEIYPVVARKYHTTASRVERAIRHSIETMSEKDNDTMLMKKIFEGTISSSKCKPTNGEFIASVVEYLRLKAISAA